MTAVKGPKIGHDWPGDGWAGDGCRSGVKSPAAGDSTAAEHQTATQSCHLRSWLFRLLWLFIIGVSVIDGYLVVQHRNHLVELNPQGRVLIALNGGQVWLLVAAKFLGTVLACTVLLLIHQRNGRLGTGIALVLAGLQLCLLLFLLLV
ncbi:MAG: hypothetical protein AB7F89_18910 [Pirellulaceae bacterium]